MTYGFIYGLYHPVTNELRYIGQTKGTLSRRLSGHVCDARRRGGRYVLNWIKSLLGEGLRPTIQRLGTAENQEELDALEVRLIAEARVEGVALTNHDDGGMGAPGRSLTNAHKAKLHSPEVRARMAATRKGQPSPRKGVTLSLATRAKISLGKKGNQCRLRRDVSTEDMVRLREQGLPYHEIGRRFGVSKTMVSNRLNKGTA